MVGVGGLISVKHPLRVVGFGWSQRKEDGGETMVACMHGRGNSAIEVSSIADESLTCRCAYTKLQNKQTKKGI